MRAISTTATLGLCKWSIFSGSTRKCARRRKVLVRMRLRRKDFLRHGLRCPRLSKRTAPAGISRPVPPTPRPDALWAHRRPGPRRMGQGLAKLRPRRAWLCFSRRRQSTQTSFGMQIRWDTGVMPLKIQVRCVKWSYVRTSRMNRICALTLLRYAA